ncbi:hypothetical protein AURDEDRAFT_115503 [Auricularia subglabra TFB-10046 SS5]|uniref:Major facilitator superfamily (MFS) profile domain-containing protein n=1 Tax=Auricularia subglabra (strain TFB-10046 / SS5) TaxID=717982 RepID=J0LKE5_AURST|nr:hypothetical protein AURDEDRAFT_115503 [Auricularia subglabra TFB-10046 SS5]
MGVPAAMTIPSSLTLLVRLFPEEKEQSRAIGVFGASAALGNVLGLVIGALLTQLASWPWVFWFAAIVAIPVSLLCAILVPRQPPNRTDENKFALLDIPGISILTSGLILLIFAFTSSGTSSWSSAMVIAPLVISIALIALFFFWESRIDPYKAAFPPKTWRYTNFAILFGIALLIFMWFTAVFLLKITMWQEVNHWSAINSAVHFLPVGTVTGFVMIFSGRWTERFQKKYVLLVSSVFLIAGSALLPFTGNPANYWKYDFPAFVIGSIGCALLFVNANVAIFFHTPPEIAGIVGAVFNCALQLGSAVGAALITSVQLAVDKKPHEDPFAGRAAGYWFLLGIVGLEAFAILFFYRTTDEAQAGNKLDEEVRRQRDTDAVTIIENPDERLKASKSVGNLSLSPTVAPSPTVAEKKSIGNLSVSPTIAEKRSVGNFSLSPTVCPSESASVMGEPSSAHSGPSSAHPDSLDVPPVPQIPRQYLELAAAADRRLSHPLPPPSRLSERTEAPSVYPDTDTDDRGQSRDAQLDSAITRVIHHTEAPTSHAADVSDVVQPSDAAPRTTDAAGVAPPGLTRPPSIGERPILRVETQSSERASPALGIEAYLDMRRETQLPTVTSPQTATTATTPRTRKTDSWYERRITGKE